MRRLLGPLAVLVLVVTVTAVTLAQVGGAPGAQAAAISATGAFEVTNSKDGSPIFAASNLGPGNAAEGTVEIAATGSAAVELTLSRHDLLDTPGLGGGLLSEALSLSVTDVTDPGEPLPVYSGPLASMPDRPAGRIGPGASRRYEFVALLPAGAGDQNALQGASVSVAYSWTATEAQTGTEPGPEPKPKPEPEIPIDGPGPGGDLPAPTPPPTVSPGAPLRLQVTKAGRRLRGGRLVVWAGCDSACAISVRGRLRASAAGHHRGARLKLRSRRYVAGSQRLRIRVPVRLRRWLASAPGQRKLRAKLVFSARAPTGTSDAARRNLKLKPPRRR